MQHKTSFGVLPKCSNKLFISIVQQSPVCANFNKHLIRNQGRPGFITFDIMRLYFNLANPHAPLTTLPYQLKEQFRVTFKHEEVKFSLKSLVSLDYTAQPPKVIFRFCRQFFEHTAQFAAAKNPPTGGHAGHSRRRISRLWRKWRCVRRAARHRSWRRSRPAAPAGNSDASRRFLP